MHSRDPSPFTPAARATTLPTPSIIPPETAKHHRHHHHRLHHPHHRHHHRGPSRAATQPQSGSGASGVSTADSDSLARVKIGEESGGAEGGGGGGGNDEKDRKAWAVLREKEVQRGLGDKYDTRPFSSQLVFLKISAPILILNSHPKKRKEKGKGRVCCVLTNNRPPFPPAQLSSP